jgi:hypothetical protein
MNVALAGFLGVWLLTVGAVCGCASVRDDAVRVLNASSDFGAGAEATLEALDLHEQEDAVNHAWNQAQAQTAVKAVRAKYAKAWAAYREYRAAMLVAQAAVSRYDSAVKAGAQPDVAGLQAAVEALGAAETAFVLSMQAVREQKDGGP